MTQGIAGVWSEPRPLIGMVHLLPLPGSPGWGGSLDAVVDRATADAGALVAAGFDGLIVENYADVPFVRGAVAPETVAAMTRAVLEVIAEVTVPVGVNVLRNDARSALGIAVATGARFIRVNVHVGSMWTDQGLVEGAAGETLRERRRLEADVAILADVHVKHATPPSGSVLEDAARDTWQRGRADALVVSGSGTGSATSTNDLARVRSALPDAPLFVGSGATPATAAGLLEHATGLIVGSAVMSLGTAGAGVDPARASAFVEAARSAGT